VELSWSTFLLEIINFLVLIWILKHFLYKPVLSIIAKRRAGIEQTLTEATRRQSEAEALKQQYETRLEQWEQERQRARETLHRELSEESHRRLAELQETLETERKKQEVAEQRRRADHLRKVEETALTQGARFAGRLLESAAGPDVEARLVAMVVEDLARLTPEQLSALYAHNGADASHIEVCTAYPLSPALQKQLQEALSHNGWQVDPRFSVDPSLLAGVHITMGAWVLAANLRDELRGFAELTNYDR